MRGIATSDGIAYCTRCRCMIASHSEMCEDLQEAEQKIKRLEEQMKLTYDMVLELQRLEDYKSDVFPIGEESK